MRIRKIANSYSVNGLVLNNLSTSSADTYSCEYLNNFAVGTEVVISETQPVSDFKIWIDPDEPLNAVGTEVVNTLSGNETDKAPSVSAVNGKILWTNSSPTTAFASQTINLTNNECKNIKIICCLATDAIDYENIYEFRIGKKGIIFLVAYANSTQTLYGFQRNIDEITNNSITFSNCSKNGVPTNSNLIPKIVIGF